MYESDHVRLVFRKPVTRFHALTTEQFHSNTIETLIAPSPLVSDVNSSANTVRSTQLFGYGLRCGEGSKSREAVSGRRFVS